MHDPDTHVFSIPPYIMSKKTRRAIIKPVIEVWHHDPSDYDSTTCKHNCLNIKHLRLRFIPWKRLTRKIFQRCAYCGGPSTKLNPVNHGFWDDNDYPFWYSKPNYYHAECITLHTNNMRSMKNNNLREGYNRGYADGRYELMDGAGYHIPDDWKLF